MEQAPGSGRPTGNEPVLTNGMALCVERSLKKISKDIQQQVAKLDNVQKIESLTKRCTELYAEMKKLEKENIKQKKRADQLQKDKDLGRTELTKTTGLKEKLEKLCRELQKENNKLKVRVLCEG